MRLSINVVLGHNYDCYFVTKNIRENMEKILRYSIIGEMLIYYGLILGEINDLEVNHF